MRKRKQPSKQRLILRVSHRNIKATSMTKVQDASGQDRLSLLKERYMTLQRQRRREGRKEGRPSDLTPTEVSTIRADIGRAVGEKDFDQRIADLAVKYGVTPYRIRRCGQGTNGPQEVGPPLLSVMSERKTRRALPSRKESKT